MKVQVTPFKYADGKAPEGYQCHCCEAKNVKLWREYQTFLDNQCLLCFDCAIKDQKKLPQELHTDSIGWMVPAVPTEEGDTYWGYEWRRKNSLEPWSLRQFHGL